MANNLELEFTARTDTGRVRPQNEDAIALSPAWGFAVLADGMGGYNAGEVASGIAVAVMKELLEQGLQQLQAQRFDPLSNRSRQLQELMTESMQHANSAIFYAARVEPEYQGMGTTLVAALFHHDKVTIAHVGDSRAYRFRRGTLVQITKDHSLLQEQIDAGVVSAESARFSRHRNLVTRAVGVDSQMEVEIHDHHVEPEDIYLLCSDGLSDMLTDQEISDILIMHAASLESACGALVQATNEKGGHDNISVILIQVSENKEGDGNGLLGRIRSWMA